MKRANLIVSVAALSLAAAPFTDAWAQLGSGKGHSQQGGAVTCNVASVNASASSFVCTSPAGSATYQVDSSTAFGGGLGGLAGLKAGTTVAVTYHASGNALIADSVTAE